MATTKRPIGFGDTRQVAEFFGLKPAEVTRLAESGEWGHYCIGNRRVFDIDEIVEQLARAKSEANK